MKKIISTILCLAMIFAMAATAFGATSLCSFDVKKTDENGAPLSDAEFILIPAKATEPAYFASSDANGIATFTDVPDGQYTLKENLAPAGYVKSDDEYTIYVDNGRAIMGYETDDSNPGNTIPIPYSIVTFVNEKEENDPITVYIPVTKVVEQTGAKAPGAETFTFEIYGFDVDGKVTVVSNTVETNGAGTYKEDLVIEVETEDIVLEPFYIREVKGTKSGWTYSDAVYKVIPVFDDNGGWDGTFEFEIVENGDPVTYDEATFVNSYYKRFNQAPANPAPSEPDTIIINTAEDENPDTGAPVFGIFEILAVSGAALVIGKRK